MSRVTLQTGKSPIIIVAPHGYHEDDYNTDIIADVIASELKAFAVINRGWKRSAKAILGQEFANLNDIRHCHLAPCRDEFLNQLKRFKDICVNNSKRVHVFYIHGMSNKIRSKVNDDVDVVLGFGQGNPPSYTCRIDYKNALTVRLLEEKFNVYQAKVGGKFAAWKEYNLTQLWRRHFLDQRVNGVQIEIVNSLRCDDKVAVNTGLRITRALDKLLYAKTTVPINLRLKEC